MLDQLQEGDVLVLAGSIPASMPDDIYRNILKRLDGKGILIAVDATGNLLVNVLEYHPFLVKPNNHELGEIFGAELKDRESVIPYAKKMQEMGATNVLVSMAGEGAVLAAADGKVYLAPAPKGKLVNGVGAGDSMVAGFLTGWLKRQDYREAFHMGIATGSASAFSEYLAGRSCFRNCLPCIFVVICLGNGLCLCCLADCTGVSLFSCFFTGCFFGYFSFVKGVLFCCKFSKWFKIILM